MKVEIKSRFSARVLFSFERENNSIKLTLEAALESNADLRYADLCGADLYGADLRGADLYEADLRYADLRYANLCGADLYGADLRGADLRYANLRYANGKELKCDGAHHHITNIGSESGTLELYSCGSDGWLVKRDCFTGTKDEFLKAVDERHGNNEHAKKYRAIIAALCE